MIRSILLVCFAVVNVQCFIYSAPYQQPCGMPAPVMPAYLPANPPCASPAPIPIPLLPAPCDLPGKMPLIAAPYEVPIAIPNGPMPIGVPVNLPPGVPMPTPVTRIVAQPSCGCLETVPNFEFPLPIGMPIGNPFLPAASPVSAMAPYNMLPPACPCSRCQYLKKIPIPPPCI